ncbi:MAG: hypothetical protein KDB00_25025, partial [Planctomycetales bacterium]|nr:hypothetical protein [Planctomycetales bacterium]
ESMVAQGRQEGRQEGREEGRQEGLEEGLEKGLEEGLEKGKLAGKLQMLQELLDVSPTTDAELASLNDVELNAQIESLQQRLRNRDA